MMRRLSSLAALMLVAVLLPMHAASAGPRVGPPLELQLYLYQPGDSSGTEQAALSVSGRGCLPQDAPASVMVTLDRLPGQVFTAKPNAKGRWYVSIDIPTPIDGVYVVNATCDNYFGTTVYPTAQTDADQVIIAVPAAGGSAGGGHQHGGGGTPTENGGGVANTGNRTAAELGIGLGAFSVGLLLLLLARPRRAMQPAPRPDDVGRHRTAD